MIHIETHNPSIYEISFRLIEVLIWPVVFFIIILLFRKNFKEAMGRLGSLRADATGISLGFTQVLARSKGTFNKLRPGAAAKSMSSLGTKTKEDKEPYMQLIEIKENLNKTILDLAKDDGMEVDNKSIESICRELSKKKIISAENEELMLSLIEVVNAARTDITQAQVDDIKALWHSI
jgi:hypothetical protein